MIVRAARVVAGPPDDGKVFVGHFELWSLDNLDVGGFRRWRKYLSADWIGAEQAANRGDDR
jgi:hypothetical protein